MKVLITGASGFIGRQVLARLQQLDIDTVIMGRHAPAGNSGAEFIQTDLLSAPDFAALARQAEATHLLHLAWYAEHGKFWTSPLNLRWVETTTRLVEAFCAAGGKHVVAAGSCAEYDGSHGYLREANTPLNPSTLYGTCKDAARRLAMAACAQFNVPCAWGRIFLLYGSGEMRERLMPSLIDALRGKRAAFGINASAYRDFLHVADVAEGFITLLQHGETGAYNICSGRPVQLAELARELARLLNADPHMFLDQAAARPGEPPLLVGENLKLKSLGWTPALSLSQGLEQLVHELPP